MSGSVVLLQPGTMLIYVARATPKGHADVCGLCCYVGVCMGGRGMSMSEGPAADWDHIGIFGRSCYSSCYIMLLSLVCAATKDYDGVYVLCCGRGLC